MFKTDVSAEFDHKDWDHLISSSPSATAFQSSRNYEPHALAFDSVPLYVTAQDNSGKILGQLLAVKHVTTFDREPDSLIRSLTSRIRMYSGLNWYYGPIIHDVENTPGIVASLLDRITRYCRENKILFARGSLPADLIRPEHGTSWNPGYETSKWETYVASLSEGIDAMYNSLHKKTRHDVRQGEKNGLEFELAKDRESLDLWLEVKFAEYKHKNYLIKKHEKFNDYVWDILYKNNLEKMYLARLDGVLVSGIANKLFGRSTYQHSIINPHAALQGGSFVTWNAIKWSKEHGFLTYDMGGANPEPESDKERGIRFFKSKWGGRRHEFLFVTMVLDRNRLRLSKALASPGLVRARFGRLFK